MSPRPSVAGGLARVRQAASSKRLTRQPNRRKIGAELYDPLAKKMPGRIGWFSPPAGIPAVDRLGIPRARWQARRPSAADSARDSAAVGTGCDGSVAATQRDAAGRDAGSGGGNQTADHRPEFA